MIVARRPARLWVALLIAPPTGAIVLIALYPFALVFWNGIRPAACNVL